MCGCESALFVSIGSLLTLWWESGPSILSRTISACITTMGKTCAGILDWLLVAIRVVLGCVRILLGSVTYRPEEFA